MAVNMTQVEMLRKLLRHGATERVVRLLSRFRPAEIAEIFSVLSPADQRLCLDVLFEHGDVVNILLELPNGIFEQILERLTEERIALLLEQAAVDDAVFVISLLDEERIDAILASVSPKKRDRIEHVRAYPEQSAGSLMTSQMLTIREELTAQEAIDAIRGRGKDSEFVFYVYVVNEARTFLGVVPIRRLISSPPEQPVREIMVTNPVAAKATDDQEHVADLTARYNLLAVPVVDDTFRLLGVITVDDVIDILHEEATEDMYLMQGLSEEDRVYSPVSRSIGKRFPWTLINLVTAFTASSVVGLFEGSIARVAMLATFMPIVAGTGGNAGTQTLTVITRALALGELSFSDGKRAIFKQVSICLVNGIGAGLVTGLIAWIWKDNPAIGLVLFLAMIINMALAGLIGAAAPLALKALRLDPALGGGIIVTAFTDTFGFMTFLGLATLFISYLV